MNFNGNNWLTKFKDHPSYYDGVIVKTQHTFSESICQHSFAQSTYTNKKQSMWSAVRSYILL